MQQENYDVVVISSGIGGFVPGLYWFVKVKIMKCLVTHR